MYKILQYIQRIYKRLISSIAFIPSIIILASLLLGIAVFYFEDYKYSKWLGENLKFVLVTGTDNARMVLTTIIGGIISLTVFSFSMVMVVLNRTSAALSPRLLPQLVAQKFHQVVLGIYMGTIIYSLILVISIGPDKNLPALGILISMLLAILSLALFIYFIHSISSSIQVNNIMRGILQRTMHQLDEIIEQHKSSKALIPPVPENGMRLYAKETGYYFYAQPDTILNYLKKENLHCRIDIYQGQFLLKDSELGSYWSSTRGGNPGKLLEDFFYSSKYPNDREEYYHNFIKISEIAVKALSPGINDPGTAQIALRFLTVLYETVTTFPEYLAYETKDSKASLSLKLPALEDLLTESITPIRQCAGNSTEIFATLFTLFESLLKVAPIHLSPLIKNHIKALIDTADHLIENRYDRHFLNQSIETINALPLLIPEELNYLR